MTALLLLACKSPVADTHASDTAETGAPVSCPEGPLSELDLLGNHAVTSEIWEGTLTHDGVERQHLLELFYPSDLSAGPYPVLVFEHAYGSAFDEYAWLFEPLASRGWVIASAEHDANGWNSGDWWGNHAALADGTARLLLEWNDDASSPFYGALDPDAIAVGGHSHGGGGVLRMAQSWAPMNPSADHAVQAVVLITTRPDLDSGYSRYPATYAGMAPLLNLAGGMDQDGTTAYGQGIAVYEGHGRPGAQVYVEGAEHYSFTDDVNDGYATVERSLAQDAGVDAVLRFLAATVEGDPVALASWRGDAETADVAPSRTQWHDPDVLVVDAFELDGVEQSSGAIVGVDGQTFVNGFLGDTLQDPDASVALLAAEIRALTDPGDSVLFYQDASRGTDTYALALDAVTELGSVTRAPSVDALVSALEQGGWDLVVVTQQDGSSGASLVFDAPLAAWICGGGRAILSDFRMQSTSAAETLACAGAAFDGSTNWGTMTSTGALFEGSLSSTNPGWGIWTYGLSGDTVWATNEGQITSPHNPLVSDLGHDVTVDGFVVVQELWAVDTARALTAPTYALEFAWDAPSEIVWSLDGLDARQHPVLSLRALQVHGDPLNTGPLDLELQVVDAAGGHATWSLSEQGLILETAEWLERTTPKSVFQTWRMPLGLARDAGSVDLGALVELRLRTLSESGRVVLDDVEFSAGLGCW